MCAKISMRILIVGINYAPELTGIGKYTSEMAEWLGALGHEIRIIASPPYYPEWRIGYGYSAWKYSNEVRGGVRIWRCPIWIPTRQTGRNRLLHLTSFALSSLPILVRQIFWRPHVIFAVEPALSCAPASWACAKIAGSKSWLHVQDFEVDAAFELGILRKQRLRSIVSKAESQLMRRFDRVSAISENMATRLIQKKVMPEKVILFPNWIESQSIYPLSQVSSYRAKLGIDSETCVALYSGNMGEKQGLEIVLDAARILRSKVNLLFVLCGDGAARKRLMQLAMDLPNVRWISLQPLEKLNDLLNLADVHLLPQKAGVADLVMPSKLLGMLASGRPVLVTADPETQLAKMVSLCGKVVEPGNTSQFAQELEALARAPREREKMGKIARLRIKAWDKGVILGEFEQHLQKLCSEK